MECVFTPVVDSTECIEHKTNVKRTVSMLFVQLGHLVQKHQIYLYVIPGQVTKSSKLLCMY